MTIIKIMKKEKHRITTAAERKFQKPIKSSK